jgi:hypothetical protein
MIAAARRAEIYAFPPPATCGGLAFGDLCDPIHPTQNAGWMGTWIFRLESRFIGGLLQKFPCGVTSHKKQSPQGLKTAFIISNLRHE